MRIKRRISFCFIMAVIELASLPCFECAADTVSDRNVQSLDGIWDIIFDSQNEGRKAGWYQSDLFEKVPTVREIPVPGAWELIEEGYEGVAFYRREFEVPTTWPGKTVRLRFDAVNYLSEVWLNDEVVGWHEGGFTPFEFRVDEMLRPGQTNVLILRVVGPIILSDKNVDGIGPLETPQWRGGITGGIWQSVCLKASGEVYVEDVFIEPNISDQTATLHVDAFATIGSSIPAKTTVTGRFRSPRPNSGHRTNPLCTALLCASWLTVGSLITGPSALACAS